MSSHPPYSSGIQSLCAHYPHMKDVWMSNVLPFLIPSMSLTRVLFYLLRWEFRARIDSVVHERVYLHRQNPRCSIGFLPTTLSSRRCSVGFLPATFAHYNIYCTYITKDWHGEELSIYDLRRVNDDGEECWLTRYTDLPNGGRVSLRCKRYTHVDESI
jgi:hypothetical protein